MGVSYKVNTSFFRQADSSEYIDSGSIILDHFGLKSEFGGSDRWKTFWRRFKRMDENDDTWDWRVIFFARHGQAVHNLAHHIYGSSWDGNKSRQNGDGDLTWGPDPVLTQKGYRIASTVHTVWATEIEAGLRLPDVIYCSPLSRCLMTNTITFSGLTKYGQEKFDRAPPTKGMPVTPIVVENCREHMGRGPSGKRRSKTYIEETFPEVEFERGFTEDDELFDEDQSESDSDLRKRVKKFLGKIFDQNENFISVTSHQNFIEALCEVVGHRHITMQAGGKNSVLRILASFTSGALAVLPMVLGRKGY